MVKKQYIDLMRNLLLKLLTLKSYEKLNFFIKNKYWPNVKSPKTFNEIISRNKLFYKDIYGEDVCVKLSDKFKVRDLVISRIGAEYLCELFDVYGDSKEFKFASLPQSFVLKANHGCGNKFIKIVRNKNNYDERFIKQWIDKVLKSKYGALTNELWYQKIQPKVIAEELLNESGVDLKDYKFFMVQGEVILIQVDQDRFKEHKKNLYSPDWKPIDVEFNYPIGTVVHPPSKFNEMKIIAKKLSKNIPFCRVDLYQDEKGRVKFGEITLAPATAWGPFKPRSFDYELGTKYKELVVHEGVK